MSHGCIFVKGIERPLNLYYYNKLTILYLNNNRSSSKSKHIDIKFPVVKKSGKSGQIFIEHLGTNSMMADPLTKGLPPKVFHEHVAQMSVLHFEESLV